MKETQELITCIQVCLSAFAIVNNTQLAFLYMQVIAKFCLPAHSSHINKQITARALRDDK